MSLSAHHHSQVTGKDSGRNPSKRQHPQAGRAAADDGSAPQTEPQEVNCFSFYATRPAPPHTQAKMNASTTISATTAPPSSRPDRRRPRTLMSSFSTTAAAGGPSSSSYPRILATSMGGRAASSTTSSSDTSPPGPLTRKLTQKGQDAVDALWFMAKNFIAGTAAGTWLWWGGKGCR